jgi:hypothetical protein
MTVLPVAMRVVVVAAAPVRTLMVVRVLVGVAVLVVVVAMIVGEGVLFVVAHDALLIVSE